MRYAFCFEKPAALFERTNVDWAQSENMAYESQKAHISRSARAKNRGSIVLTKKHAFSVSEADFLSVTDISDGEEKSTQTYINFEDSECQTDDRNGNRCNFN